MITYEEHRLRSLADEGRWIELLGAYRQARAAAVALDPAPTSAARGRAAAATAPLGHLIAYAAPPEVAARLFDPDGGPGTAAGVADHDAGPLWEVLATRHRWRRLAPLLGPPPVRRLVAQTRVLLGEDLSRDAEPDREGVPLRLEPWEAAGRGEGAPVREYLRDGGSRSALLTLPASREGLAPVELPEPGARLPGQPATRALAELAGWARAVCVRGPAPLAAAQLAPGRLVTGGYLPFALAWPALVQAGVADRAHGAAHGRLALWRALAAMAGAALPPGPVGSPGPMGSPGSPGSPVRLGLRGPERVDRGEVGALVARMRCFTWEDPADRLRHLHLALEDPVTGLSWAVSGSEEV
ncbi:hypothetical protein ABZW10_38455 [Kitasatospora sp. NPDC004723]|uniref:hypothetical protein n=1 Tax=Kitasatospora sp. NPDC004723 TaxID=3154288 RepID=UPI0033A88035